MKNDRGRSPRPSRESRRGPRRRFRVGSPRPLVLVLLVIGLATLIAGDVPAGTVRTLSERYTTKGVQRLAVEAPSGELRVTGGDGDAIVAEAEVSCSFWRGEGCKSLAEGFRLVPVQDGDRLLLELRGPDDEDLSGTSVSLHLEVPRRLSLAAQLEVGQVRITGMEGDLDLEVSVGRVEILMKEERVGAVDLHSGVGDVELLVRNRDISEEGLGPLGRSLTWSEGEGSAELKVHCGVGGVRVSLD